MTEKTETTNGRHPSNDGVVMLADLASRLLESARDHHSQRAAETINSGPSMRATVIALAAGAELAEHESPPAATLQVIVGRTELRSARQTWLVHEGEIVAIPAERHALSAITDAVVLLTVALH
ncbi:LuxR family transcriptional regulator [Knoellia sp. S7-12]|uniref:LuxR family transcriptional regulator n=1 Tax=Knoellia sp. S7-12 TaxID=3126698 RepID=UPI00336941C9